MKTQTLADPVSANEKFLVWGLFFCFMLIIAAALLPENLLSLLPVLETSSAESLPDMLPGDG